MFLWAFLWYLRSLVALFLCIPSNFALLRTELNARHCSSVQLLQSMAKMLWIPVHLLAWILNHWHLLFESLNLFRGRLLSLTNTLQAAEGANLVRWLLKQASTDGISARDDLHWLLQMRHPRRLRLLTLASDRSRTPIISHIPEAFKEGAPSTTLAILLDRQVVHHMLAWHRLIIFLCRRLQIWICHLGGGCLLSFSQIADRLVQFFKVAHSALYIFLLFTLLLFVLELLSAKELVLDPFRVGSELLV